MHLQPKKYWSTLLYNDIHNYGGILLHNDDGAGGLTEGAVAQMVAHLKMKIATFCECCITWVGKDYIRWF